MISGKIIESPFTMHFNLIFLSIEGFFVFRLEKEQEKRSVNSINDIENNDKRQISSPPISGLTKDSLRQNK